MDEKPKVLDFAAGCIAWLVVLAIGAFCIWIIVTMLSWSYIILSRM